MRPARSGRGALGLVWGMGWAASVATLAWSAAGEQRMSPGRQPEMALAPRIPSAWPEAGVQGPVGRPATVQDPEVVMEIDTTVINLGDPLELRLRVNHPPDWSVAWPDSLPVEPWEVLRYETPAPDAPGGASSAARVHLTSFELGELEIPPIEIRATAPDGTIRSLFTDPFRIGVESVGLDASGEIRQIRGPLAIERNWWLLTPWLLLAAALGAGGFWLRGRLQQRPAAAVTRPAPPPRPHHLVALEALAELERSSLLERGQVKRWHVRVSEIVRSYVEGQLEVPALEMTTGEVVAGLREAALDRPLTERFHIFLERCDLVKFAKLRPGEEASRELLEMARTLVNLTSGLEGATGADDRAERVGANPAASSAANPASVSVAQAGNTP